MFFLLGVSLVCIVGCRKPLPVMDDQSDRTIVAAVQGRSDAIQSFSASGKAVLTDHEGSRVSLDAVLIGSKPDKLRLRSYKMGTAVFDLTLIDHASWVWQSKRVNDRQITLPSFNTTSVPIWDMLVGGIPATESFTTKRSDGRLIWSSDTEMGTLRVAIDPATSVVRQYRFVERSGAEHLVMLDEYQMVNGFTWPGRIVVESAGGQIVIRVDDIELNGQLPAGAFAPPAGAVRSESNQ